MTTFQRIQRSRASDSVTEQIVNLINTGVLKPGDKLPSEAELIEQTRVGRPSLRAALHTLEALGIIEIQQGVGAFVREIDPSVVNLGVAVPKLFSQRSIREAIEFRAILEPEIAATAAKNATPEMLQELCSALQNLHRADSERGYPKSTHIEFHMCLARMTGNELLISTERSLLSLWEEGLERAFVLSPADRGDSSHAIADHRVIYDAVAARDPDLARQRTLEHNTATAKRILSLTDSNLTHSSVKSTS